jgi:hypothetical protein
VFARRRFHRQKAHLVLSALRAREVPHAVLAQERHRRIP